MFFFFFQAEDGIRDYKVTGVQTCALPIFGNFTTGAVSGVKFEDHNANGNKDAGDQGLGGWTIRAYNASGNVADSALTAGDGTYTLDLQPGTYTICEVSQAGYTQSKPTNTLCKGLDTDVEGGGYTVTVTSSGSATGKDFGNFTTGAVSGVKFEDHNANGNKDAGDQGLGGWTIRAYNASGNVADSALTAGDGTYT